MKTEILFNSIACERSLYILSKNNPIRVFLTRLLYNTYYRRFILFIILASSGKLAIETYFLDEPNSSDIT